MTRRLQRVNSLIAREVSQLLLKEMDFPLDVLVTVTRAETVDELVESRIFISVLPEKKANEVIGQLNKKIYFLQQKLNQRLRMRPLPKIIFSKETKTAEAGEIEEILAKIEKKDK